MQSPSHGAIDPSDNDDDGNDSIGSPFPYLATALTTDETYRASFRHAICVASQSEQSAYMAFVSGDTEVPESESPEHYVPSCTERHGACKMCGNGPMYLLEEDQQALRVDLNVLGVCRQLYEEGNHLLWATNTFSYDDPRTFVNFFGSLNPAQKRKLTRIHINASIGGINSYYQSAHNRARYDNNYWGPAFKIANLNMLRGVQALNLCLHQGFHCINRFDTNSAEKEMESAQQADVEVILRLRALSMKQVTVIVSDDSGKVKDWGLSHLRWIRAKKIEYAESIRTQLMDPNGAELVKAEAEAANLARNIEIRDNAAARLKRYKLILKGKRAETVRAAKRASREEAKAVSAQKALLSSYLWKKKKGKELQEAADEQEDYAITARESADDSVAREAYWQEQVANSREKLKRAMARLGATPEEIEDEEELEKLMEGLSDSDMHDSDDDGTQDHKSVQSDDEESMVSHAEEEASDEDNEIFF